MCLVLLKAVYEPVHCHQLIGRRKDLLNRTNAACHLHGGGIVLFVFVTGGAPPVSVAPDISEITTIQRPPITRYGADIHKDTLDNIPVFEGKQGELTQFLNTIESYSTMYRVHKTDLMLLRSRGKAHEIISHAIAEDPDME